MEVSKIFERYKVKTENNQIYDPIRMKYVRLTPEEIVRQKTIKFLMKRLGVPQETIIVERGLSALGVENSKKRIDIGILDEEDLLMGVVECKAGIINTEAPYRQAQDYLIDLNTRYFFVTDGHVFDGYFWNTSQFIRLDSIPKYEQWYYYPTESLDKETPRCRF